VPRIIIFHCAAEIDNGFGELPLQSAKAGWVIDGSPQQLISTGLVSNPRIAIAAKLLIQSKNLLKK
jgi:hypothetical protein